MRLNRLNKEKTMNSFCIWKKIQMKTLGSLKQEINFIRKI